MEVLVRLATTGEQVYSATSSEIQDWYVWELRLQIWRELASAPYFSYVLFRTQDLRGLRLPSDEERRTIISGLEFQQRSLGPRDHASVSHV